ncbi:hypothetical protein ES703_110267 [subsurface metagenome]
MKKIILYPPDHLAEDYFNTVASINTLILHDETLGVTQRALKALRDELAERIQHELQVFQVSFGDGAHYEVYGFFLVDKTAREVVIIGDGFRGDGGGEGGAGARAALALLAIYHLVPIEVMPDKAILYREEPEAYREIVEKVLEIAEEYHFEIAREKTPQYVDFCFSQLRR